MISYRYPDHVPTLRCIQPDYAAWLSIQKGMTRAEVFRILGEPPREILDLHEQDIHKTPYVRFGYLDLPLIPHRYTYDFVIGFDGNDRVWLKADPFNGRFSLDGIPLEPLLITPLADSKFTHYPRLLDVRWFPCSGMYPMTYCVQVGHADPYAPQPKEYSAEIIATDLQAPFFVFSFVGSQPGRVRVKAKNALGESPWSEARAFDFSI